MAPYFDAGASLPGWPEALSACMKSSLYWSQRSSMRSRWGIMPAYIFSVRCRRLRVMRSSGRRRNRNSSRRRNVGLGISVDLSSRHAYSSQKGMLCRQKIIRHRVLRLISANGMASMPWTMMQSTLSSWRDRQRKSTFAGFFGSGPAGSSLN